MEINVNEKKEINDPMVCVGDILQLDIDVYVMVCDNWMFLNLATGCVTRYTTMALPARKSVIESRYAMPIHAVFDGGNSRAYLELVRKC